MYMYMYIRQLAIRARGDDVTRVSPRRPTQEQTDHMQTNIQRNLEPGPTNPTRPGVK